MKKTDLTVISCALPDADRADLLLELLDADSFTPTTWQDIETGETRLDVFLENADEADGVEAAIRDAAALAGLEVSPTRGTLPADDWMNAWKRFFHIEHVSERVTIRPSWEPYEAKPGECVITLDPGMSFGTGRHPTTAACLRLLDAVAHGDMARPVLDCGCGSGILAIAARKLGFAHVSGFDLDPDAVRVARENAALNGVAIHFEPRDLVNNLDTGAVVLANILGPVLIRYAAEVACAVQPGGTLIASGILDSLYPEVKKAFETQGLREDRNILIGEWRSGAFVKP